MILSQMISDFLSVFIDVAHNLRDLIKSESGLDAALCNVEMRIRQKRIAGIREMETKSPIFEPLKVGPGFLGQAQ